MKFKPGDKVKCIIAPSNCNNTHGIVGQIYTVRSINEYHPDAFYLEETGGNCWAKRFELVSSSNSEQSPEEKYEGGWGIE